MPTYDYHCKSCGHELEEFQSMTAKPLKKCPECGKNTLERKIGVGAGIIFKGGGFYETDYRSDSYKKSAESEKKAVEPAKGKDSKGSAETTAKSGDAKPNKPAGEPTSSKSDHGPKKSQQHNKK